MNASQTDKEPVNFNMHSVKIKQNKKTKQMQHTEIASSTK